jgi:cytidine deaminase
MTNAELIQAALAARLQAYAPYSNFLVGAAVAATSTGEVFTGCNVENASYGLTICAERSAIFTAVGRGLRQFDKVAVASGGGVLPCGACLQVLSEFGTDEMLVLLVDFEKPDAWRELTLRDLMPQRFKLEQA